MLDNVDIIASYSRDEAIADGVLVEAGYFAFKGKVTQAVVTPTLMDKVPGLNAKDRLVMSHLVRQAIEELRKPCMDDYEGSKMRWFKYDGVDIMATWNTYEGITVMHPSDY